MSRKILDINEDNSDLEDRDSAMTNVGVMIDVETLGNADDGVVWQAAVVPFDLDDPDTESLAAWQCYFPIDPQIAKGSTVDASVIEFWMFESQEARQKMKGNISGGEVLLDSRIREMFRVIKGIVDAATTYEIWVRGADYDLPKIRKLFKLAGISHEALPWDFWAVNCLRTLTKQAGVKKDSVPKPRDFVEHSAYSDCKWQIRQYAAAQRALGSGRK